MTGRRRPLGAAAVVLALGLLTGCSDDPAPPPAPSPAQTSTPTLSATTATPTATIPPAPLLPAAATTPDQAGAEAFLAYFLDVYNWSYRSYDAELLEKISQSECTFCSNVVADVRKSAAQGLTTVGGAVSLDVAVAAFGQPTKGLVVSIKINQTAMRQTEPGGGIVYNEPEAVGVLLNITVTWVGNAWTVSDVERA